ncbi:hypothetical protein [Pseudomonas sp. Irchel 3E13]|uniref:hypothetical protein n=1 Tax=Pseudomonas sp. Irchel 3E13 TaxID=2008975 RepID=UPI00117A0DBD|nr:hypothetical protein [Pseudomonas sp. Irchel 3E13]
MRLEATPLNSPAWLVFYSVLTTWSCANIPTAFAMEWWFGIGAVGFAAVAVALVIVSCRELGKGLSGTHPRPPLVEDVSATPAVQALETKLDALCKHLGVNTVN